MITITIFLETSSLKQNQIQNKQTNKQKARHEYKKKKIYTQQNKKTK